MPEQISPMLAQFGPLALMVVVFYFLLIRPQKKEQKRREAMLSSLKKGDKVVTAGGMYGVITNLNDNTVTLKVAEKVEIEMERTSVGRFLNKNKNEALDKK